MTSVFDRRSFLAGAAGTLAVAASTAGGRASAAPTRPGGTTPAAAGGLRLGGPVWVDGDDPEVRARAHREKGYRAGYCPDIPLDDTERIEATESRPSPGTTSSSPRSAAGCNLLDADPAERRKNLQTVTDGLALAEAVGARCCVDIAGSFNPDSWFGPHPDNLSERFFDAAVENARKIIDAVKPTRTTFCYEMMALVPARQPRGRAPPGEGRGPQAPSPSTSTRATSSTHPRATTPRASSSGSASRSWAR